jgi:hypothetical protein
MRFSVLVLALFFLSAPALEAASQVDFSGYVRLRGYGLHGYWNKGGQDGANNLSEQYATSRFRVNMVFRPTDEVEVRWRFHGPHNARWGSGSDGFGLRTMYIYGVIKTDYGKISLGRISTDLDSAGLQTLGYIPTWGLGSQAFIFDTDSEDDGIMYHNTWGNGLGLKAFYIKEASDANGWGSDQDHDRFSIEPYYKWDNGGLSMAIEYGRNMGKNQTADASAIPPRPVAYYSNNYQFSVNPAFMHQWSLGEKKSLAFHLEGKFAWGERKNGPGSLKGTKKVDVDGAGLYADLNYKYGSGDVSLAGWWLDGTADNNGKHDLVDVGEGFYPFVVFYQGHSPARNSQSLEGSYYSGIGNNHWALALMGNHSLTKEVQLNYGVAHFEKSKTRDGVAKDMGTEIDLGLTIQLLDNLKFSTKAGYFITGDYYKERYDRRDYGKNIMAWGNELIISF